MSDESPVGERIITAVLNFCVIHGNVEFIRRVVFHGVRLDSDLPVTDRSGFSNALRELLIQYMYHNERENIETLLQALDSMDFDSNPEICRRTLDRHRSNVCRIFAQAILHCSVLMNPGEFSHFQAITLGRLMYSRNRIDDALWNSRTEQYCRNAFRKLKVEVPEHFYRAFRGRRSDPGKYPDRPTYSPRKRGISDQSEYRNAVPEPGPSRVPAVREQDSTSSEAESGFHPCRERAAIASRGTQQDLSEPGPSGLCQAELQDYDSSDSGFKLYAELRRSATVVERSSPPRCVQDPRFRDDDASEDEPSVVRKAPVQDYTRHKKSDKSGSEFPPAVEEAAGPSEQGGASGRINKQDVNKSGHNGIDEPREAVKKVATNPIIAANVPERVMSGQPGASERTTQTQEDASETRASGLPGVRERDYTSSGSGSDLHPGMKRGATDAFIAGSSTSVEDSQIQNAAGHTGAPESNTQAQVDASQQGPSGHCETRGRGRPYIDYTPPFQARKLDRSCPTLGRSFRTKSGVLYLYIAGNTHFKVLPEWLPQAVADPSLRAGSSASSSQTQADASKPGPSNPVRTREQDRTSSRSVSQLHPAADTNPSISGVVPRRVVRDSRIQDAARSPGQAGASRSNTEEVASRHGPSGLGKAAGKDYSSSGSGSELHPGMKRHAIDSFIAGSSPIGGTQDSRIRDSAGSSRQARASERKDGQRKETSNQEQDSESSD